MKAPRKPKKPKFSFRILSKHEAYLVARVRAAIIRARQERYALYKYTQRYHRKDWRPIQRERLAECGKALTEAQNALRRFERVMSFGLRRGVSSRKLACDLEPAVVDLGDPWAVHAENVLLRAENATMKRLIEARMRVGYVPDP